jgi:hypothetical protein
VRHGHFLAPSCRICNITTDFRFRRMANRRGIAAPTRMQPTSEVVSSAEKFAPSGGATRLFYTSKGRSGASALYQIHLIGRIWCETAAAGTAAGKGTLKSFACRRAAILVTQRQILGPTDYGEVIWSGNLSPQKRTTHEIVSTARVQVPRDKAPSCLEAKPPQHFATNLNHS